MRTRSVGILIKNGNILLFKRFKNGEIYYALPGGTLEEGETPEETLIREMKEELNIEVKIEKTLFNIENEGRREYYFYIDKLVGELELIGPEMVPENPNDRYEIYWTSIDNFQKIKNFYPALAKKKILEIIDTMIILKNYD